MKMDIISYLKNILEKNIDSNQLNDIEKFYDTKLNGEALKISNSLGDEIFFGGKTFLKLLSKQEVLDATSDLNVSFKEKSLIPMFDSGDNDYIVFSFDEKCWYKYNIVDDVLFCKHYSIMEYFN